MNKVLVILSMLLVLAGCKGRGSGPLQTGDSEIQSVEGLQSHQGAVSTGRVNVSIEPCNTCIKISDLIKDQKKYSGNTIEVTGIVTKFNPAIMEKNWVHIQDGSEYKDVFDLTVTTDEYAEVGDTITFKGKISIDKDFGYGYFYDILMEDAVKLN